MRNKSLWAQIAAVSILLSGCGQSKLDARQLDFNNGLAYQHGLTTPFTGTVEWKDQIPNEVAQFWSNVTGTNLTDNAASCETQFTKGVLDGSATCSAANGQKILDVTFKNEAYEGTSKFYSASTGKLNRELHWSAGRLDGTAEIYTDDGKQLLQQVAWKNGIQDGPTKVWSADGTLLTDTVWSNGKTISGKINDARGSYEYKDGQLDGPATWLGRDGQTVIAKGVYSAGRRVGPWQDWMGNPVSDGDNFIVTTWSRPGGILDDQALQQLPNDFQGATLNANYVKTNWTNDGKLDGDVEIFDKNNKLIMAFEVKNNLLDGPFHYISAQDGTQRSFTFTEGKLNRS